MPDIDPLITVFMVVAWFLAVASLTKFLIDDFLTDTPRGWLIARAGGTTTKFGYMLTCPWCMSFWVALSSVALPVVTLGLSWWAAPVLVLAARYITGFLAGHENGDEDVEIITHTDPDETEALPVIDPH